MGLRRRRGTRTQSEPTNGSNLSLRITAAVPVHAAIPSGAMNETALVGYGVTPEKALEALHTALLFNYGYSVKVPGDQASTDHYEFVASDESVWLVGCIHYHDMYQAFLYRAPPRHLDNKHIHI